MVRSLCTFLAVVTLFAAPGKADLIIQLGQGGSVGGTNFGVTAGGQVQLEVYLTQQGLYEVPPPFPAGVFAGDYRLSNSGAAVSGLGQYVFDIGVSGGELSFGAGAVEYGAGFFEDPALLQPGGNTLRVGAFATPDILGSAIEPVFASAPSDSQLFVPNTGDAAANSVLLAKVTIDAAVAANGDFALALSSPFDPVNTTPENLLRFTIGNDALAPHVSVLGSNATLSVSAVPEPSGLAVLGFVSAAGALRRRRA